MAESLAPQASRVIRVPLPVEDRTFEITAMFVGNPQCITFVEDFEALDWKRYGRALESHLRFPRKTNVEFVRVIDPHTVEIRIWERGAGHTESSGTGSIASALGALLNAHVTSPVRVITEGGILNVEWKGEGEPVFLSGDAEVICRGIFMGTKGI
jgi:diaminopimelate epimerase